MEFNTFLQIFNLKNSTRNENVLQMSLLQHRLLRGDKLTFYDGNLTRILQEYTALTHTPALSFYSTLPDAKVVFTANASNVNSSRSFSFLYRTVPKGIFMLLLSLLGTTHSVHENLGWTILFD